jgi:hypothetical protein
MSYNGNPDAIYRDQVLGMAFFLLLTVVCLPGLTPGVDRAGSDNVISVGGDQDVGGEDRKYSGTIA